jgi:hypothetical protein
MAFKVQELMVNVMSGKAGMTGPILGGDDPSTCMTKTISGESTAACCVNGTIFFRNAAVPQARLALLRNELRMAVARA